MKTTKTRMGVALSVALTLVACSQGRPKPTAPDATNAGKGERTGFAIYSWVATHDSTVVDLLAESPGASRRVPVQAWFPAGEKASQQVPGASFVAQANPVLAFVHGTGGAIDAHASLYEELASRGWVVLAAAHPGLAFSADYPDKTSRSQSPRLQQLLGSGQFHDPFVTDSLALFQADLKLVTTTAAQKLPGLDLSRVAYGGHSLGAVVATGICRIPASNCVAVINLDGVPLGDLSLAGSAGWQIEPRAIGKPALVITSELPATSPLTKELWSTIDVQTQLGTDSMLSTRLLNSGHLDLTDAVAALGRDAVVQIFGPLAAGSIDPKRAIGATRTVVADFLDRYSRCDRSVDVVEQMSAWPELSLRSSRSLGHSTGCD